MLRRACTALLLTSCLVACDDGSTVAGKGGSGGGGQVATGGTASGGTTDPGPTTGGTASGGTTDPGPTTGGTASGGTPNVPDPPGDPENPTPPERPGFTLLFQDDFQAIDTARWGTGSHTFAENAAQFDPAYVKVEDGFLQLIVDKADAPSSEGKLFRGGELRSHEFFGYGRFETRARFAKGSGLVSSLFTYYDHWAKPELEENWNEIDIEYLGKNAGAVQFNVIHWNAAKQRTAHEKLWNVDFAPGDTFHVYAIEWLPSAVNFYIDEQLVHTQTDQVQQFLTLDSRLMMNAWVVENTPDLVSWAGAVDESALPAVSTYDWVRVYKWDGN